MAKIEGTVTAHANITIIRSQTGEFARTKGKEVMEGFIKAKNGGKDICATSCSRPRMMPKANTITTRLWDTTRQNQAEPPVTALRTGGFNVP